MPSRPTVIAMLALFVALAGTATAATVINGKNIRKGTVTAREVKDRSLGTSELKREAVQSLRNRGPVTGEQIADGSVGAADLAPNSVGGSQVTDRSLTAGDLAADTISATEIGVGAVGDSELAANSVGNAEIKGQAISRNQLRPAILRVGTVRATIGAVASGTCASQFVLGATYSIPSGALSGTVVEVETPAELGNGLIGDARPSANGNDMTIQVCNFSGADVTLGDLAFPFVAFGT